MNKKFLGRFGEDLACEYLVNKGYKVIARNYRKPWGEIDIVAQAKDRTLVFVEVKTMHQNLENRLTPEDQMNYSKLVRFQRVARYFAARNSKLIDGKKGWQMDVVAIEISEAGKLSMINHYKNVN